MKLTASYIISPSIYPCFSPPFLSVPYSLFISASLYLSSLYFFLSPFVLQFLYFSDFLSLSFPFLPKMKDHIISSPFVRQDDVLCGWCTKVHTSCPDCISPIWNPVWLQGQLGVAARSVGSLLWPGACYYGLHIVLSGFSRACSTNLVPALKLAAWSIIQRLNSFSHCLTVIYDS